nr:uncharacterized protein LOC133580765 [Nerophis lumbriciformis]
MNTSGLQANDGQNVKELDTMKESISDIINQLQDIDPSRLSFSPFLDLDTQICMAPVSDSPESSVEELRSSSGSQGSLEPPPLAEETKSLCLQQPNNGLHEAEVKSGMHLMSLSTPITAKHNLATPVENCLGGPTMSSVDIPNGNDTRKLSSEPLQPDGFSDEAQALVDAPPDSVELSVWSPEGGLDTTADTHEASARGRRCCSGKCCMRGRVCAFLSMLASFFCALGILHALDTYVVVILPDCSSDTCRVIFTLCCCAVATVPILLVMILGAVCRFCTASFGLQDAPSKRHVIQQLFVTSSLELLFLYTLNLVVLAVLVPKDELKLVPLLMVMFILGRLVYWASLNVCSSMRGFGSGLTVFPLIALVVRNAILIYTMFPREPLFAFEIPSIQTVVATEIPDSQLTRVHSLRKPFQN